MSKYKGKSVLLVIPTDLLEQIDSIVKRIGKIRTWKRTSRNEIIGEMLAKGLPAMDAQVRLEEAALAQASKDAVFTKTVGATKTKERTSR